MKGLQVESLVWRMETNTASVALSTEGPGTRVAWTYPTTFYFSLFFHRRSAFVYILKLFFRQHELYCRVSFYLLLEMMQAVL